jgi:hypothetical protein
MENEDLDFSKMFNLSQKEMQLLGDALMGNKKIPKKQQENLLNKLTQSQIPTEEKKIPEKKMCDMTQEEKINYRNELKNKIKSKYNSKKNERTNKKTKQKNFNSLLADNLLNNLNESTTNNESTINNELINIQNEEKTNDIIINNQEDLNNNIEKNIEDNIEDYILC